MPSIKQGEYNRLRMAEIEAKESRNIIRYLEEELAESRSEAQKWERYYKAGIVKDSDKQPGPRINVEFCQCYTNFFVYAWHTIIGKHSIGR